MSQANETPVKTLQAGVALKAHRLVHLSAGKLAYAAADTEDTLGTTDREAFGADEYIGVRTLNEGGFSRKMVAVAAFAKGATLYQAANGKVDDSGTIRVGIAMEAAGADGDIVEVAISRV
jgi:hypothetical protein